MPIDDVLDKIKEEFLSGEDTAKLIDYIIAELIKPAHHTVFWGDRLLTLDKSAGFLSDTLFRNAYDAIRGAHQYDQYVSPQTISWRLHTLVWAAKCGLNLEGDFIECGVFRGDMSWIISQTVDFAAQGKQFYMIPTTDFQTNILQMQIFLTIRDL